jgi:hypothetical protein
MAINSRVKMIIAMAVIGGIGFGIYSYKQKEQALVDATMKGLDLGERYGQLVKQGACLPGLRLQHAQCSDHACELSAHGFISGCMRTAARDQFCLGVPSPKESKAALGWSDATCAQLQMAGTRCENFIHKVLAVCYEQNTGKKRGASELIQDGFNRGYEKSQ